MSKNLAVAVVVILILAVGGFYFIKSQQSTQVAPAQVVSTPTPTQTQAPAATEGAMMKGETLVKITANGYNPKVVTIKVGDTVSWENDDSANHTVNSSPHPTHTDYPPLNLGLIKPGDKNSLTFDKAGTYKYHDHLNPSLTGSVTVQ